MSLDPPQVLLEHSFLAALVDLDDPNHVAAVTCYAELIDQYGFARMTDGSVWYWEDAYTGLYGFSEFFGQGLAGGALGCLCGGLLAGLLIGGAVLVAGRKKG